MNWEYRFLLIDINTIDESESLLNSQGNDGWEAVAVIPKVGAGDSWTIVLMKRSLES
ncbi:MAG: DUF4177 domain-containing protein [Proteobacteria bacterium]|nr:DUF4177 domain-containing protein [Pseudomonadota bacterium]